MLEKVFSYIVVSLAFVGVIINIWAFIVLNRKKPGTHFHLMLKVLSIYDLLVSLVGGLTYGLPHIWPLYQDVIFPYIAPTLAAFVHIFLMTSVFITVLISFERYIRICYLCQLRTVDFFTDGQKIKQCLVVLVILPCLFYLPKFFEFRLKKVKVVFEHLVNCTQVLSVPIDVNWKLETMESHSRDLTDCIKQKASSGEILVPRYRQVYQYEPTELRSSKLYYQVYSVGLNTVFASILPLACLIYLNICTVRALKQMSFQHHQTAAVTNVAATGTSSAMNFKSNNASKEDYEMSNLNGDAEEREPFGQDNDPVVAEENEDHHQMISQENCSEEMQAQEKRLARISITIVWLFIVCHMWKFIPTIYESYYSQDGLQVPEWPFALVIIEYISHSLIVFNSAVNFLIYVFL